MTDPTVTDPDTYRVVFENARVRVLEYRDESDQRTSPHEHPDSVMITLTGFTRMLVSASGESRDVTLDSGESRRRTGPQRREHGRRRPRTSCSWS